MLYLLWHPVDTRLRPIGYHDIKKSNTGFSQNDHFTFQYEAGVSVFEIPTFHLTIHYCI
jgi:hypothetical protein